jgi:hypothetical protein
MMGFLLASIAKKLSETNLHRSSVEHPIGPQGLSGGLGLPSQGRRIPHPCILGHPPGWSKDSANSPPYDSNTSRWGRPFSLQTSERPGVEQLMHAHPLNPRGCNAEYTLFLRFSGVGARSLQAGKLPQILTPQYLSFFHHRPKPGRN